MGKRPFFLIRGIIAMIKGEIGAWIILGSITLLIWVIASLF